MNTMKKIILPITASLLAISITACASSGPYGGEKAQVGAVTGAAAGAAIGALTSSKKDRGKGALIGAGAGAVLGGTGGYALDKRDRERDRYYRDQYYRDQDRRVNRY